MWEFHTVTSQKTDWGSGDKCYQITSSASPNVFLWFPSLMRRSVLVNLMGIDVGIFGVCAINKKNIKNQ